MSASSATSSMAASSSTLASSTAPPAQGANKPMSKLALLAQKRREAAQRSETRPSAADPSNPLILPVAQGSSQWIDPSLSAGQPAASKPLSKLAQKMAAARAARTEGVVEDGGETKTDGARLPQTIEVEDVDMSNLQIDDSKSRLFSASSAVGASLPSTRRSQPPSPFFAILTATSAVSSKSPDPTMTANMHLPVVRDPKELERRIYDAFGAGVESPDDIVLRARQGRSGTAETTRSVKAKKGPAPNVAAQTGS